MTTEQLQPFLDQISLPKSDSHKGQNGKVMIIGGSELFHSASQWALTVVSRMVDMVFYASIPSNNQLIQDAKKHFANGIVIPRQEIENYIEEADVVLIGPGMERGIMINDQWQMTNNLNEEEWNNDTRKVVNYLVSKYPHKKWVIDAGALQMIEPSLLNENCIITPHQKEFDLILNKVTSTEHSGLSQTITEHLSIPTNFPKTTVLLKGQIDTVFSLASNLQSPISIPGGNVGMTKGGTGDVLAGLVSGLYAFTDNPYIAAVVGSHINKMSGDELYKTVGPFFNATDLADQIPRTLANVFQYTV